MPAIPPGTAGEHVERLRKLIAEYLPGVEGAELVFHHTREAVLFCSVELVPRGALWSTSALIARVEEYVAAGHQWVRLGGVGFLDERRYLCVVDTSKETGSRMTAVEVSGPRLDVKRKPVREAGVLVGFLEVVAERLTRGGETELASRLLALYRRRHEGVWSHEQLQGWPISDVRTVAEAMEHVRLDAARSDTPLFAGAIANVGSILFRLNAAL